MIRILQSCWQTKPKHNKMQEVCFILDTCMCIRRKYKLCSPLFSFFWSLKQMRAFEHSCGGGQNVHGISVLQRNSPTINILCVQTVPWSQIEYQSQHLHFSSEHFSKWFTLAIMKTKGQILFRKMWVSLSYTIKKVFCHIWWIEILLLSPIPDNEPNSKFQ